MRPALKIISSIVGALLVLVGAVWTLQGANVLTQGFMAGHRRWIVLGLLAAVVGIALIIVANTRRRKLAS